MSQTEGLQKALAGEHAAVYAIGVAGGQLRGSRFTAARKLYNEHQVRRDRLTELLVAAGTEPVAAEPAYDLPSPVVNATTATALVRLVEQRLAAVYGDLVAAAEAAPVRTYAIQAMIAAAREQIRWGGTPTAFPGGS
jgi:hypothetical protein